MPTSPRRDVTIDSIGFVRALPNELGILITKPRFVCRMNAFGFLLVVVALTGCSSPSLPRGPTGGSGASFHVVSVDYRPHNESFCALYDPPGPDFLIDLHERTLVVTRVTANVTPVNAELVVENVRCGTGRFLSLQAPGDHAIGSASIEISSGNATIRIGGQTVLESSAIEVDAGNGDTESVLTNLGRFPFDRVVHLRPDCYGGYQDWRQCAET